MIFPFSRPNLGMEWMRWQAALTFKPLGALSLAKGAAIGMAVPPKILSVSLQHPDNGMEIQGEDVWLTLAGQRHLVRKGAPEPCQIGTRLARVLSGDSKPNPWVGWSKCLAT